MQQLMSRRRLNLQRCTTTEMWARAVCSCAALRIWFAMPVVAGRANKLTGQQDDSFLARATDRRAACPLPTHIVWGSASEAHTERRANDNLDKVFSHASQVRSATLNAKRFGLPEATVAHVFSAGSPKSLRHASAWQGRDDACNAGHAPADRTMRWNGSSSQMSCISEMVRWELALQTALRG